MTPNPACSAIEPLYADDTLLVLDKPSGLLAVPGRGADKQDCLSARVRVRFPDALVVHRLDMATSGLRTRLELEPVTGRPHQLRVHLRELGHPILGDALYAPPDGRPFRGGCYCMPGR